ncbi:MAG: DUF2141 domain-containing protein [Ottowia sp.]|uniref:DUF2141 domain-containing protein n=1 Tax=Ottowia sp. TaxID=1898956 RepID=UPI0039E40378
MKLTHALLPLAAALLALPASAVDLQVTVLEGPAAPAMYYLALFDSAEALANNQALLSRKAELRDGTAQLLIRDLPAGRYAIKSFADENGNAKLDTNILGLPTERYGFSNNAIGRMGPPTFDAAAVELDADKRITIRLR